MSTLLQRQALCMKELEHIASWCASRRLRLNGEEDILVWLHMPIYARWPTTTTQLLWDSTRSIRWRWCATSAFDWTAADHISRVTEVCYHQFCCLWQIRRLVGQNVTVLSYLLHWLSRGWTTETPCSLVYHSIQFWCCSIGTDCCVCLVIKLGPRNHVSAALMQFHWLPVQFHITF